MANKMIQWLKKYLRIGNTTSSFQLNNPTTFPELPEQVQDAAYGFGYKSNWWLVPSNDSEKVADAIGMTTRIPVNWHTGINYSYNNGYYFVSPPINNWVFIISSRLPLKGSEIPEDLSVLEKLSEQFGKACAFGTMRIVNFHFWAKAEAGQLIRTYAYAGDLEGAYRNEGDMTPEEIELGFEEVQEQEEIYKKLESLPANDIEEQVQNQLKLCKPLTFTNEEHVMSVAAKWAISPIEIGVDRKEIVPLGWLGYQAAMFPDHQE